MVFFVAGSIRSDRGLAASRTQVLLPFQVQVAHGEAHGDTALCRRNDSAHGDTALCRRNDSVLYTSALLGSFSASDVEVIYGSFGSC